MPSSETDIIRQNYSLLSHHIPTIKVLSHLYRIGIFNEREAELVWKSKVGDKRCSYKNVFGVDSTDIKESRAQLPRADSTRSGAQARDTAKTNRILLHLLEKKGPHALAEFLSCLDEELLNQLKTLENQISKLQI